MLRMLSTVYVLLLLFILFTYHVDEIRGFSLHQRRQLSSKWSHEQRLERLSMSIDFSDLIPPIQQFSVLPSFFILYVYDQRPRGYAKEEFLTIKRIPQKGKGVVAKQTIPADTVIGEFPGYVKNAKKFAASKQSEAALIEARKYTWKVNDDFLIDPTNENGKVEETIKYLGGLYSVSATLAFINEPNVAEDCNIRIEINDETPDKIQFVTNRLVQANEELLIDYGPLYNRDSYKEKNDSKTESLKDP